MKMKSNYLFCIIAILPTEILNIQSTSITVWTDIGLLTSESIAANYSFESTDTNVYMENDIYDYDFYDRMCSLSYLSGSFLKMF